MTAERSNDGLIKQAIESAKCRIYKLNFDLDGKLSAHHQKKAENQKELMEITVEALEKQIPKKIEVWNGQASCPCCKKLFGSMETVKKLVYWEMTHCKYCGQALDWKVE